MAARVRVPYAHPTRHSARPANPASTKGTTVTDLDAIVARITALPVSVGAGIILASRDDILQAITGTTQPTAHVRTATSSICCEYCGSSPVAEELSGHPMLNFAGTPADADIACAAYLTEYRGWTITAAGARCDDCAAIDFTQDA